MHQHARTNTDQYHRMSIMTESGPGRENQRAPVPPSVRPSVRPPTHLLPLKAYYGSWIFQSACSRAFSISRVGNGLGGLRYRDPSRDAICEKTGDLEFFGWAGRASSSIVVLSSDASFPCRLRWGTKKGHERMWQGIRTTLVDAMSCPMCVYLHTVCIWVDGSKTKPELPAIKHQTLHL